MLEDQGWAKIFEAAENAYLGVVYEKHGYHRAASTKPAMLTFVFQTNSFDICNKEAWVF